jgi:hypothetical protein
LKHVYIDISWSEVAKYIVATPEGVRETADLINRFPDRFLFGTDEVAPATVEPQMNVYAMYDPLWKLLTKEASHLVRMGNYERLFNQGRQKVRAWEKANLNKPRVQPPPTPASGVGGGY